MRTFKRLLLEAIFRSLRLASLIGKPRTRHLIQLANNGVGPT